MSATKETVISIDTPKDINKPFKEEQSAEINILCINLTPYSTLTQLLCCTVAVFVCYLAYGYFLELVFSNPEVKPISLYVTLVQFVITAILSYVESLIRSKSRRKVPIVVYMLLAALTLGTISLSNLALSYLNYPTQLIFKSCKLIPVMIGSILIMKKRYAFLDYIAAVLMCFGLTMFTLANSNTSANFNFIGVVVISLALLCDAVIGNVQEKAMKQHQASNNEVVYYSYAIGSLYLLAITGFSGILTDGYTYCAKTPKIYASILLIGFTGYVGLQAVLTLIRVCGATVAVTVTAMRKVLSIVLSFLLFNKPFVFQYLWSGMLIILAIYLNNRAKKYPNYTPTVILLCWRYLQSVYQSEYRYLTLKTKIYADNV